MQLLPFSATQYYMTQDWGSLTIAGLNKHLYINTFIIKIQILKKAESSITTVLFTKMLHIATLTILYIVR